MNVTLVPAQKVFVGWELVSVAAGKELIITLAVTEPGHPLALATFAVTDPVAKDPHFTVTKLSDTPPPPVMVPLVTVQA